MDPLAPGVPSLEGPRAYALLGGQTGSICPAGRPNWQRSTRRRYNVGSVYDAGTPSRTHGVIVEVYLRTRF